MPPPEMCDEVLDAPVGIDEVTRRGPLFGREQVDERRDLGPSRRLEVDLRRRSGIRIPHSPKDIDVHGSSPNRWARRPGDAVGALATSGARDPNRPPGLGPESALVAGATRSLTLDA